MSSGLPVPPRTTRISAHAAQTVSSIGPILSYSLEIVARVQLRSGLDFSKRRHQIFLEPDRVFGHRKMSHTFHQSIAGARNRVSQRLARRRIRRPVAIAAKDVERALARVDILRRLTYVVLERVIMKIAFEYRRGALAVLPYGFAHVFL